MTGFATGLAGDLLADLAAGFGSKTNLTVDLDWRGNSGTDSLHTVEREKDLDTCVVGINGLVSMAKIEEMEVFTLHPDKNSYHYQY